ncbi:MAG: DUF1302 domain-containing protein [Lysobacterales bacterium]
MIKAMNLKNATVLIAALLALPMASTQAFEFGSGEWRGSFDTTISYGASWRANDLDPDYVGQAYHDPLVVGLNYLQRRELDLPGKWSVNNDNGNRNYPDAGDLVAHTIKFTSELDISKDNYGLFTRFMGFYDFENADQDFLPAEADERVGKDLRLLDLYVWAEHEVGERFLNWRLGRQVVSWGESLFIQGGINVINPVDVSRLRVAGAELKEAFEGVNMLWGTIDLTPKLSVEALYMFEYREIIPDPTGVFFSTDDIGTPGASFVMLGFGAPDQPVINPDLYDHVCVQGNYDESDSPLPASLVAAGCGAAVGRVDGIDASDSGQYGVAFRYFADIMNGTEFGFYFLNYHSRLPVLSGTAVTYPGIAQTGEYYTEYPEDIQLYGISFNSNVGTWAVSGEVSYRPNLPLQMDDIELLIAALSPTNPFIAAPALRFYSQMGEFDFGETIPGWAEHESWQAQISTLKVFGPNNFLRANAVTFAAEVGYNYVADLPDKDCMRYNGPGTDLGGMFDYTSGYLRNPLTEPADGFADDSSWGYRFVIKADYNNAIGATTISPRFAWSHDVSGTTPGPGGSFIDGRKQWTIGVGFNYLEKWVFDFSYTDFSGGGIYNLMQDRDFYTASVRYSF